jgi:hypothetical protein
VGVPVFEELGVPPDADFNIRGPAAFTSGLVAGLAGWGVARDRLHPRILRREFRVGPVEDAGHRSGPAAAPASAGGSRGGRAAYIRCSSAGSAALWHANPAQAAMERDTAKQPQLL